MSSLVSGEILGVFFNTLTADGKYPVQSCGNVQLQIQIILSEKQKTFSEIFVPFLDSISNFEHFEINMIVIANVLPNLETVKVLLKPVSKKHHFRIPFDSQHVKASQMPAKSP